MTDSLTHDYTHRPEPPVEEKKLVIFNCSLCGRTFGIVGSSATQILDKQTKDGCVFCGEQKGSFTIVIETYAPGDAHTKTHTTQEVLLDGIIKSIYYDDYCSDIP